MIYIEYSNKNIVSKSTTSTKIPSSSSTTTTTSTSTTVTSKFTTITSTTTHVNKFWRLLDTNKTLPELPKRKKPIKKIKTCFMNKLLQTSLFIYASTFHFYTSIFMHIHSNV